MSGRSVTRRTLLRLAVAGASAALARRALALPVGAPPHWIGTARFGVDDYRAVALDADGRALAERRLPDRAHGVAVHSGRGIGCVFARRPGNWLCTFDLGDLAGGRFVDAPPGRRFSGHGVYSRDGRRLFTTENDIERQRGVIGVHDVASGYRRVGEFDSHGIGPHEIVRPAGGDLLVVANGGIATHPDHGGGRMPLNLDSMRPDIVVLDARDGTRLSRHALPDEHHRVSLRHLAVDQTRRVWFAAQFATAPDPAADPVGARAPTGPDGTEDRAHDGSGRRTNRGRTGEEMTRPQDALEPPGPGNALPLAGSFELLSRRGRPRTDGDTFALDVLALPPERVPQRHAYLSSVASDGRDVVYTAARDGIAFRVDARRGELDDVVRLPDCSGVAGDGKGFVVSSGLGEIVHWSRHGIAPLSLGNCAWDNHLYDAMANR